jgi:succinoglycan biosynthesis transport protein ExoP
MRFTWQDIWGVAKRWWWLVIIGVVLSGGPSYYLAKQKQPTYAARTRLMVGSGILSVDPNAQDFGLSLTLAQMYAEMVRMRPITQGVVNRLHLDMGWWELAGRIQPRVIPSAQVLEITVIDHNPEFAALAANAVADELVRQGPSSTGTINREFINQELAAIQAKIATAQAQMDELSDSLLSLTSAAELEEARARLNELEQLRLSYHSTYVELAGLLNVQSPNSLTVVEPASPSYYPISPNPKKEAILATMAGLALSIAAIFVLEFIDDTLRVQDSGTQSVLGLPLLGIMARITGDRCDPHSPAAEMIRQLRTKVLLSSSSGRLKSLVVTSPTPGDGKTILTANLGVTMAGGGTRVVLIDADLRAPAMHEWLDQPNLAGLTELLNTDQAQWEQLLPKLLHDTDVPGLSFISAGRPPLDPSILLISPRMSDLLALLHQQFDFVLFDSPPVLAGPDSTILATLTEGALLVVSPGKTSRKAAGRARDKLMARPDANLIGVALNRMSLRSKTYQYTSYNGDIAPPRTYPARLPRRLGRVISSLPLIGRPADPDLISLSQAASVLGVKRDTVKRWCREGRLPAVRKGLRLWVKQDELQSTLLDRLIASSSMDLPLADEIQGNGGKSKAHLARQSSAPAHERDKALAEQT